MIREIVLDTETTGVDARKGDRIIEIGCVELINHCTTGRVFQKHVNPQRPVSEGAFAVHGISDAFLADKPLFADIADDLLTFLGDATLVIHNASFDVGFLDMELNRVGLPAIRPERVVDTLLMARRKHPGTSNTLDALSARYGIDTSRRIRHGALLDAEILSDVYIELLGGRQAEFGLATPVYGASEPGSTGRATLGGAAKVRPVARRPVLGADERAAHQRFVSGFAAPSLWNSFHLPLAAADAASDRLADQDVADSPLAD